MLRLLSVCAVAPLVVVTTFPSTVARATEQQRFHQGRYASPLTAADFTRYGGQMDPNFPHPWTITIRRGRWHTNEHPAYGGGYLLQRDMITFVVEYPAEAAGTQERLRWRYGNRRLTFTIVSGVEGGDQAIYLAHPWRWLGP